MTKTVDAVYSGGVLKPLQPLEGLAENDRVVLTVSTPPKPFPFSDWVGGMSDEDAAEMMRVIDEEFERIDPDDWK